ncbi:MAG: ScyD/ScyE family protein [Chloroflexota bacterium]|nr:ScyD/ScyE family protein [Chloroflexota bacterium]
MRPRRSLLLFGLLVTLSAAGLGSAMAQTPSPAADAAGIRVVGSGLVNPRGLTAAPDGRILVALGGTGGETAALVELVDGCPAPLVEGIRSYRIVFGAPVGVADVAVVDGTIYFLVAGGDIDSGAIPNGLYRLTGTGEPELVANISAFIRDNPVAERPPDYDTDGQPYHLFPVADGFLVSEGNSNQLLRVALDGRISRVADLSAGHPIPTGLTVTSDGTIYVATFTAAPYPEGGAVVLRIDSDGSAEPVWRDLTMIAALAVGPDNRLFAVETATGHGAEADDLDPASGRIVELLPDGSWRPVVTSLPLPTDLAFAPDGAAIIAGPVFDADNGEGIVLSLPIPSGEAQPLDASVASSSPTPDCV